MLLIACFWPYSPDNQSVDIHAATEIKMMVMLMMIMIIIIIIIICVTTIRFIHED